MHNMLFSLSVDPYIGLVNNQNAPCYVSKRFFSCSDGNLGSDAIFQQFRQKMHSVNPCYPEKRFIPIQTRRPLQDARKLNL
jgi:hypothetical protein